MIFFSIKYKLSIIWIVSKDKLYLGNIKKNEKRPIFVTGTPLIDLTLKI